MSASDSESSFSPSSCNEEEEEPFQESTQNKLKFYTSDEIVIHNSPDDFWVIVNNVVFDLTSMIREKPKPLSATMKYLLAFGGKDLSSYFDETGMPKLQVSTFTGKKVPIFPAAMEKPEEEKFWWEDEKYQVGRLTRLERPIRVINTLTAKVHKMVVCDEDTIADIQLKYRNLYNHHAGSYTWRKNFKDGKPSGRLYLNKTLTENGILPLKNDIGPAPAFWLYFNDDFTIA